MDDTTAMPNTDAQSDLAMPAIAPRRILLAVTGLSPQIVTETLYALAVRDASPWIPTEVHLVTTATGKREAELNLLAHQQPAGDPGWFHRLRADYDLPPILFDTDHIHVLCDAAGAALDDIRTPADNERAADFITEIVRRLTGDAHSQLHVSIAGGRKTMGYYLGYALSLYGRAQDQLSHVLVSEPFENNRAFYYPTPYRRPIAVRRGATTETHDAQQARVDLARIPFVRLREGLPDALLAGETSFSGTVQALNRVLGPPKLTLDLQGRLIRAGQVVLALPPAELALLALFARRAQSGMPSLSAPPKSAPDPDWAGRYLAERRAIGGELADLDTAERALRCGMDGEYFSSIKSKLHRRLQQHLGASARFYLIHDGGYRPRRYGLTLSPAQIGFETVPPHCSADKTTES